VKYKKTLLELRVSHVDWIKVSREQLGLTLSQAIEETHVNLCNWGNEAGQGCGAFPIRRATTIDIIQDRGGRRKNHSVRRLRPQIDSKDLL